MSRLPKPPEPWHTLLTEVDKTVQEPVELFCIGGFVLTVIHGVPRQTGDLDFLEITPCAEAKVIGEVAGKGSSLSQKHKVYLDHVTVIEFFPDSYKDRVTEIFPSVYRCLRLFALDPYDLALTKMGRNIQRDRDDVKYLAKTIPLDLAILEARYRQEMRPYISVPGPYDDTLEFWKEMINEERKALPPFLA